MACIRKRRGRWVIDFYDQQGKRRWKTLPEGTTKTEARSTLRLIEGAVEKGSYVSPSRMPSFAEIADSWLDAKKPNLRHSTFQQYKGHAENHLKPFFGSIEVNWITYDNVENFLARSYDQGVTIPALRKIPVNLGAIISYACRKRFIDYNPARDVEKPKGRSEHTADGQIDVLTPEQIRLLFEKTSKLKYKTLFMTAMMTGARQGELFGLKWSDFDWYANQVRINRTFNHRRFYEPKTRTSKRKIDLPPQLVIELKNWKLASPKSHFDLVFPNEEGKPLSPINMVRRKFKPALRQAGVPRVRLHDLRHTYASLLIEQGEHPKYIQTQMGHTSIKVTMDTYGHLMNSVN
jgi:integrase